MGTGLQKTLGLRTWGVAWCFPGKPGRISAGRESIDPRRDVASKTPARSGMQPGLANGFERVLLHLSQYRRARLVRRDLDKLLATSVQQGWLSRHRASMRPSCWHQNPAPRAQSKPSRDSACGNNRQCRDPRRRSSEAPPSLAANAPLPGWGAGTGPGGQAGASTDTAAFVNEISWEWDAWGEPR